MDMCEKAVIIIVWLCSLFRSTRKGCGLFCLVRALLSLHGDAGGQGLDEVAHARHDGACCLVLYG